MGFSSIVSSLYSSESYVPVPFLQAGQLASKVGSVASGALDSLLPRNPVSQCRQLRLIPTFVEVGIGRGLYSLRGPSPAPRSAAALSDQVQRVFKRLVTHVDRELPYELRVVQDSREANASCLPGGKVVITTALLSKLQRDLGDDLDRGTTFEDRLAAVLGHEMTHAAAGHLAMDLQRAVIIGGLGQLALKGLSLFMGPAGGFALTALGVIAVSAVTLGQYNQSAELEADRKGMKYAARAGFNPAGGVWVQKMSLQMMGRETSGLLARVRGVLSSHPPSALRLKKAQEALALFQEQGAEVL